MPTRIIPRSHDSRAQLIARGIKSAREDIRAGNAYVPTTWIDSSEAFLTRYQPKVDAISQQIGLRSTEIAERVTAIDRLSLWTRHGCTVLKLRTDRLGHPDGILRLYGLELDGNLPRYLTADQTLDMARKYIKGDRLAVEQGYPPMSNPSAAELQTVLDAATLEADQVSAADERVDHAQLAAEADAAQADELIGDLIDYLEFAMRKFDAASQRRVLRRYGFQYSYKPGETPDAEEAPAAAPEAAPA